MCAMKQISQYKLQYVFKDKIERLIQHFTIFLCVTVPFSVFFFLCYFTFSPDCVSPGFFFISITISPRSNQNTQHSFICITYPKKEVICLQHGYK